MKFHNLTKIITHTIFKMLDALKNTVKDLD